MNYKQNESISKLLKEFAVDNNIPVITGHTTKDAFRASPYGMQKKKIHEILIAGVDTSGKQLAAICVLKNKMQNIGSGEFTFRIE